MHVCAVVCERVGALSDRARLSLPVLRPKGGAPTGRRDQVESEAAAVGVDQSAQASRGRSEAMCSGREVCEERSTRWRRAAHAHTLGKATVHARVQIASEPLLIIFYSARVGLVYR